MEKVHEGAADMRREVEQCVEVMRKGGVILYPTDTVWGIGCDARCSEAVRRIYELKRRADHKAMIVLVSDESMLERTVSEVPEVAWELIDAAVKPLTVVYDKGINVAPELLGPDGSIGVRLCRDRFAAALCRRLRGPVVSTSANVSGQPTASVFPEISPEILNAVDYVADYRREDLEAAPPSSVIKLGSGGEIKILRP